MKGRVSELLDARASTAARSTWRPAMQASNVLTTGRDASNGPDSSDISSSGRVEDSDPQSGA
jgi:hypothetical protein